MRILEGMKNVTAGPIIVETISPLQMHRQQTQQAAISLTLSNLNGINSEHGIGGVNAYIRDQVKRAANAAALNSSESAGGHRSEQRTVGGSTPAAASTAAAATISSSVTTNASTTTAVKPNTDDPQNAMRSTHQPPLQARQPLQALPSTVNSNNSQQSNATSPSIPHAKALYDFESKEPGYNLFSLLDFIFCTTNRSRFDPFSSFFW